MSQLKDLISSVFRYHQLSNLLTNDIICMVKDTIVIRKLSFTKGSQLVTYLECFIIMLLLNQRVYSALTITVGYNTLTINFIQIINVDDKGSSVIYIIMVRVILFERNNVK